MNYDPAHVSFLPVTEDDLPLLHRWLNNPQVAEWYREPAGKGYPSLEYVIEKWMPRIQGKDPGRGFIFTYDAVPTGYIQCGRVDDDPQYKKVINLEGSPASIDLYIGEDDYRHRGLGSIIIWKFLKEVVFTIYDATVCTIDPEPTNIIAIRAYEKAGFHYVKTAWNPIDNVWAYIMVTGRDSID